IAYSCSLRTSEFGIRIALGAKESDILKLVVRQGFGLTIIGLGAGLAGAIELTRYLSSLLYEVKPTDPITFVFVSAILAGVALFASCIPARRAMRVDPMVALRYERGRPEDGTGALAGHGSTAAAGGVSLVAGRPGCG